MLIIGVPKNYVGVFTMEIIFKILYGTVTTSRVRNN